MKKSQGKKFEENFRKSIDLEDKNLFFYRFKDGTANWSRNEFTRFQNHNISDCMIFYKGKLFICELKSHKGKSIPLTCIRPTQLEEMVSASEKENVIPLLIVFFSDLDLCYALHICDVNKITEQIGSKSISLSYCMQKGFKIENEKLRTNNRFYVKDFLDKILK